MFRFRLQPILCTIVNVVNGTVSGQRSTLGTGLSGEPRAGNSKKYCPSCTACSVIRRWCNHHFSAIFAKKVVETGILWQFYGLIYRPVQGHSLLNLLPKTKLSSKEQQKRLWCIQLALKPDVQHKSLQTGSGRTRWFGSLEYSQWLFLWTLFGRWCIRSIHVGQSEILALRFVGPEATAWFLSLPWYSKMKL